MNIQKLLALAIPFALFSQSVCIRAAEELVTTPDNLPVGETTEVDLNLTEYMFVPNHLEFELGKAYKLKIHNVGTVKHELGAPVLAVSVFTIGVDVLDRDGKVIVTFRGKPAGIELTPGQSVYWRFVTIKAQPKIKEIVCDEPHHLQHGMRGTFTIR